MPMKTFFYSLLLAAALGSPALAQTSLPGTWHGRLEAAPGKTIVIHFVITAEPGGQYSAVLTSPEDGAIKNVRAASVKYADNRLIVDVPALSGGFAGTLRNGAFEGEWTQEGTKLPLTLRPVATQALKKADIDALRGEWFGKYRNMGLDVTIVLRFSAGADGAPRAVLDVPEQGVKDWETKNLTLDDGHFSVEIPAAMTRITGTLKGSEIVGQWVQFGNPTPLTLKKGRYVATPTYLDLPASAREQLKGKWSGTLGPLTVVMRFETDAQGRTVGFFDSPQQNLPNVPISDAKLEGTKYTIAIAGFGATFTGELGDGKLTGEWMQTGMPKPAPLVLTRGK
jgi:hypothetical protein